MAVSLQGFRFELKVRGEHFGTVCHSGERHTAIEKSMPIWEQLGLSLNLPRGVLRKNTRKPGVETAMHSNDLD